MPLTSNYQSPRMYTNVRTSYRLTHTTGEKEALICKGEGLEMFEGKEKVEEVEEVEQVRDMAREI